MNLTPLIAIGVSFVAADAKKPPPSALGKLLGTPVLEKAASLNEMQKFLHARIPAFEAPADTKQWDGRAADMRKRLLDQVVLKGHPADILTEKPAVEWLDTIEIGKGYRIRTLRYEGYPGLWVPALLYEPENLAGKVPVILNPNGHERGDGKAVKYKQLRCINMAKRGMIALNPEWIGMGELNLPGYSHNESAYLDLCGRAGVGVFYMLLKRGLDVLLDHPNADEARVAVTGLSGGGWQTIFFGALDTRVTLAVPNAGYIGQAVRLHNRGDIGDLEQCSSDMLTIADYVHLTAMLAPRPALLIYNEKDNCCFPSHRARPCVYDPVAPLYERYGIPDHFQYHENKDPGTHNYKLDNRQQLYKFLNTHFVRTGPKRDQEIPSDDEVLTKKRLTLGVPENNATFFSLADKAAAGLPTQSLPEGKTLAQLANWLKQRRTALRKTLRYTDTDAAAAILDQKDIPSTQYTARAIRIKIGTDWRIPAIDIASKATEPDRIAIVVADGGRPQAEPLVDALLKDSYRVIAADLLFTGQCKPQGFSVWQYAMLMANVGQRPLGLKVAQLAGLVDHFSAQSKNRPIALVGIGRVSSVTAVLAAALSENSRPAQLVTVGLPASLKLLIEKRVRYNDAPSLFCFGLLKEADVAEMLALTLATRVQLIKTEGDKPRIERALAPFARLAESAGKTVDLFQRDYKP